MNEELKESVYKQTKKCKYFMEYKMRVNFE